MKLNVMTIKTLSLGVSILVASSIMSGTFAMDKDEIEKETTRNGKQLATKGDNNISRKEGSGTFSQSANLFSGSDSCPEVFQGDFEAPDDACRCDLF